MEEFVHHFDFSDKYFVTSALISNDAGDDPPEFPMFNMSKGSVLRLPQNWGREISGKVDWTGSLISTEYANYMLPLQSEENRETIYNGNVLSFTVSRSRTRSSCDSTDEDRKVDMNFTNGAGVQIRFPHNVEAWGDKMVNLHRDLKPGETRKAALGSAKCVFWDTVNLTWSTEGCKVIASTPFETTCECDHLTSFTILMDLHNYQGADVALQYLTYTFCIISIVCLIVSVFLFSTVMGVQNERILITRNLCCCLIVGNLFVVITLNNPTFMSQTLCFIAGFLTHYAFLAAFCWMALEGWHLYKMIISVFNSAVANHFWAYNVIGYGVPLVMAGFTLLIGYIVGEDAYGGEVCWLADSFIWAFNGPILIVVVVNIIILTICMVKAHRIRNNRRFPLVKRKISSLSSWVKGCFALSVLLGSTWIFGFFALIPGAELVFSYIFVILNASQGIFIFIFRVILDKKMRQKCASNLLATRFGEHLPKSCLTWTSSSANPTSNETNLNQEHGNHEMRGFHHSSSSIQPLTKYLNFSKIPHLSLFLPTLPIPSSTPIKPDQASLQS
ncbi:Adhesion G protein-coupled receptor L2 [Folsomia candida]|uniref:Adhesion G protein-coupled receptor L2 n=1 Tax=Folsomia candida TaxID=158441 RepID=A0A226E0A5_FOLCA|nr:Adhesion G protein-coupled receptor L2 [Folsomia candida]